MRRIGREVTPHFLVENRFGLGEFEDLPQPLAESQIPHAAAFVTAARKLMVPLVTMPQDSTAHPVTVARSSARVDMVWGKAEGRGVARVSGWESGFGGRFCGETEVESGEGEHRKAPCRSPRGLALGVRSVSGVARRRVDPFLPLGPRPLALGPSLGASPSLLAVIQIDLVARRESQGAGELLDCLAGRALVTGDLVCSGTSPATRASISSSLRLVFTDT